MKDRRKTIFNILLATLVFICFFVTLEIILRTTHLFGATRSWSQPDSVLGFEFVPGKEYWFKKENDHPIAGKINNYGFRDNDWSLSKPGNTYRIAVLGDSYVEAFQVELDRTFFELTKNRLSKRQNREYDVELMNFGRSGYTQTQELLLLKNDVVQFSPDIVVLFFLPGNDIQDVSRSTTSNPLTPFFNVSNSGGLILDTSFTETYGFRIRSLMNWFKQQSALISLVGERYNSYMIERRNEAVNTQEKGATAPFAARMKKYMTLSTATPDPVFLSNYQVNKRLIREMAEFCRGKGIKFLLVTIDTPAHLPQVEKKLLEIDLTYDVYFFDDDLRDYADELNIDYIGLQRHFKEYYEKTEEFLHWLGADGHWNYKGHELVADVLTRKLEPLIYPHEFLSE